MSLPRYDFNKAITALNNGNYSGPIQALNEANLSSMDSLSELKTAINKGKIQQKENAVQNEQGVLYLDFSDLPTFGGDEPEDTLGIYSWDKYDFLVQLSSGSFAIVPRTAEITVSQDGRVEIS